MPRYLPIGSIPTLLSNLKQGGGNSTAYQLNRWQLDNCKITDSPLQGAAVLSYRWRGRSRNENIQDFKRWLSDCGSVGYGVHSLNDGPRPVDWSLADGHGLQIEVAAWLLWLYTNRAAEYAWVDQMCVPQDADEEEKMGHIKDSPAIYTAGHVYLMIAPVVDDATGTIMSKRDSEAIVQQYNSEMNSYHGASFLSRSAIKALLVNHSYMRRVWTIQEAVAANQLSVWPLKGEGSVNSYQGISVMDWPEFNAWNSHPALDALYLKFEDQAVNGYYEGKYTNMIRVLREHPSDGIAYLAMISKDLMWITMDRSGLVNDIKKASDPRAKAFVVLNNHQIQSARSFLAEDRVLALIPLIDYPGWKQATQGVPARHLVQASVAWAYSMVESGNSWKWSIRVYNSPSCTARGLDLLEPRRNLKDSKAMHGATPNYSVEIPPAGGTLHLSAPPSHPDSVINSFLQTNWGSRFSPGSSRDLRVELAVVTPHPGQPKYWGSGPWTTIRNKLGTDEVFRLSIQWGLEPWRNQSLGLDAENAAVVVVSGGGLRNPAMIIMGIPKGSSRPTTGQVMTVVDVQSDLLSSLKSGLMEISRGEISSPITAVSQGFVTPSQ
ncbi:hypothetical protein Vretimale_10204 [Volvox reticuliferus]|uniref:Heterokaryon incompatibility domain-containing protein n=1 Tax=Volvox reticuliferus TaxID=1737510 RepID=A0A8J4BX00_9CHLO|nr:hypothetical protein Vretifemale_511 [Volvox reticuliferus]GIM05820.1 hypothetical protein Vretimale_10204 [Volvox reticuliferus]